MISFKLSWRPMPVLGSLTVAAIVIGTGIAGEDDNDQSPRSDGTIWARATDRTVAAPPALELAVFQRPPSPGDSLPDELAEQLASLYPPGGRIRSPGEILFQRARRVLQKVSASDIEAYAIPTTE